MRYILERVKKTAESLKKLIYQDSSPVMPLKMRSGKFASLAEVNAAPDEWQLFERQEEWGGFEQYAWFRFDVIVTQEMEGMPVCVLIGTAPLEWAGWDATNPQFIVYVNGQIKQGIDVNHREILLDEKAAAGSKYTVDLHAYGGRAIPQGEKLRISVDVAVIARAVEKLHYDLLVPVESLPLLSDESPSKHAILKALNDTVNLLDWRNTRSEAFRLSVRVALAHVRKALYVDLCGSDAVVATCVGHTHIDVAWLWTVAQSREKVVRSFSTVLELMEQYPEYVFMSSQPLLYEFLKQDQPEVYARVKARIAEGRWEPEGAMWLEADCNVTSGESLVRQLLYGTAFFRNEFGVENCILWLPDVFGYSAALPQILKKSGIDYFMTTKISWNQFNKLPYDTFNWRGIDGTEILTYFITTTPTPEKGFSTYNGDTDPASVKGAWTRFQQKELNQDVLISYGYGDGGGGPTRGMLERARRLSTGIPGMPKVQMGTSRAFFERLDHKVKDNPRLPIWVGELYLELHRGTYTSMARNKRYNRQNEILWGEVEFLSILADMVGDAYPKDRIDAAWKVILLNQFHDILPGSSIFDVYEVCKEEYEQILADGRECVKKTLLKILAPFSGAGPAMLVVNTLGFERDDLVMIDLPAGMDRPAILTDGVWLEGQKVETAEGGKVLFQAPAIPSKGYRIFPLGEAPAGIEEDLSVIGEKPTTGNKFANALSTTGEAEPVVMGNESWTVSASLLENRFFRIELDEQGQFDSIFDKRASREVLKAGQKGNVLIAFEDRPMNNENWDIDMYHTEKSWTIDQLEHIEVTEKGPLRGSLRLRRCFADSVMEQTIRIYRDIPRVDFETHVDWQQSQILLKVAFPVEVNIDHATYEIQFGHVERPTHWNTSWDQARFEVCGHRWADLSETGYGVSLLNDCKYGHDIKDGVMRLTLIKSGIAPNPTADRGEHVFTYSLFPHPGGWREAGTLPMSSCLNVPLKAMVSASVSGTGHSDSSSSWVTCDQAHVVVETVKQAEDGDGVIMRLYESENRRGPVLLTFRHNLVYAEACNLMEKNEGPVPFSANTLAIFVKPLEIQTYRLRFA